MNVERYILEALQKATLAAVAASSTPTTKIKMIGRNFEKPNDNSAWLEVIHFPNNVTNEFWADGKTYRGIFRLVLHYPMKDDGVYPATDLIESIGSYFAKGSKFNDTGNFVTVQITDNPNLMGMMEEAPDMLIPLSIRYLYFKA